MIAIDPYFMISSFTNSFPRLNNKGKEMVGYDRKKIKASLPLIVQV